MRVLLFGIDGLTFRVLDPMIEHGLLPNFARVRTEGTQGILRSTTPPMTPPAWMSIATGLLPAGHGVYDFWGYERKGGDKSDAINQVGTKERGHSKGEADSSREGGDKSDALKLVGTTRQGHSKGKAPIGPRRGKGEAPTAYVMTHRQGGKAIWNILSEWGKKVVVANVPLTYPPEPVNGIMLSGYMAPDTRASVTYPASFKDELLQVAPAYQIDLDPAVSGGQIGDPLAETLKMTRERIKMFRLALSKAFLADGLSEASCESSVGHLNGKGWDFCFLACSGADRIQHLRWDEIMAFHPQAVAYYQMLDDALGMMLDELRPDDLLLIVSDHGFRGVRRKFYVQEYLYQLGLLRMHKGGNRYRAEMLGHVRNLVRTSGLQQTARLTRDLLRQWGILGVEKVQHATRLPDLDWANTRAWVPSASGSLAGYADIFLDDDLSEEDIQELMQALKDVVDPESGEQLFVEMHREDVYGTGPYAPPERHLIVLANEWTTLATELGRGKLWENSDRSVGIHHPDGVLYLYGAGVKRGAQIEATHVCDIVPTILARMDLPVPNELSGRVIEQAFEQLTGAPEPSRDKGIVRRKLKKLTSQTT
ncbi:MAG TPA: alkaline phosphatase family protein [Ktedonobacteraceae bacterium]|nr:alkaline phosphatase family protein [Ktedonobacteraceae bacterium]